MLLQYCGISVKRASLPYAMQAVYFCIHTEAIENTCTSALFLYVKPQHSAYTARIHSQTSHPLPHAHVYDPLRGMDGEDLRASVSQEAVVD